MRVGRLSDVGLPTGHKGMDVPGFTILRVDPRDSGTNALLRQHWQLTAAVTPPEHIHALDLDGLLDPSVDLYGLRDGDRLLGIGAIKTIDPTHVEIKSMHTTQAARGKGIARAILDHLLDIARRRGAERASLETGEQVEFDPAVSLYLDAGFSFCGPFAGYTSNPNSVFMTLSLERPSAPGTAD